MELIFSGIIVLSLIIWIFLLSFRGQFWRSDQRINEKDTKLNYFPPICAVIPARNEADLISITLKSLLTQDYPGEFSIILVDDHSTDGTAEKAEKLAQDLEKLQKLTIILAEPLPKGWTGKLWAMEQGIRHISHFNTLPEYILLTDADIQHHPENLRQLVNKAQQNHLDLTSLMVKLRCQSIWEKLLIPPFVFFFQKLYPFRWVNNPENPTAAAAGGCILIRRDALNRIGGIATIRQALIDDCTLAKAVKDSATDPNSIWLGLSEKTQSLRPYPSLKTIWDMVARTAYTQLEYSPLLLLGTLIGMGIIYLLPPLAVIVSLLIHNYAMLMLATITWLLMAIAFLPTLRLYQCSPFFAFGLPAIAFLYTLMTLDSALQYWQGRGGAWKGRVYG